MKYLVFIVLSFASLGVFADVYDEFTESILAGGRANLISNYYNDPVPSSMTPDEWKGKNKQVEEYVLQLMSEDGKLFEMVRKEISDNLSEQDIAILKQKKYTKENDATFRRYRAASNSIKSIMSSFALGELHDTVAKIRSK